ncbi:MAG: replication initiator protein A [Lactobacillus sp.]|nr:replication initiator protein A [Lactobacillus sp.]MCH3990071.1 replication initiator protein A [Lactobacillus sp.]MCH4069215.1 replication initiator protein A [Lactobacillus sp.]MCI1303517.1 replication initiator protein A [Lactobacillus sp.]MCI1329693.1 replication initiator protein A [Lactobacillus sp.]
MMLTNCQEIYVQLPKFLFANYAYRKLSLAAKVAYALLRDRLKLSSERGWRGENGEVFCIFTNEELMAELNLSEHTVIKVKRELIKAKLLRQERIGVNQPNHLYLPQPKLTAQDVYVAIKDKTAKTPVKQPAAKPVSRRKPQVKLDFSQDNYSQAEVWAQNKDLLHKSGQFMTQLDAQHSYLLDQAGTELLGKWCQTPAQLSRLVGVILGAKKQVATQLQELGKEAVLEFDSPYAGEQGKDLKHQLTLTLQKYFNAIRRAEDDPNRQPIRNHQQYLYRTMVNFFDCYANEQLQAEQAR